MFSFALLLFFKKIFISLHLGIGDWVIGDGSCPSLPTQEDLEGLNRESVVIPL